MTQPPMASALVICDGIHEDPTTGKWYLLGTYSRIQAMAFPWTISSIAVAASVTDGLGTQTLSMRLVDEAGDEMAVAERDFTVDFPEVWSEFNIPFTFTDLTFYGPGVYRIQLLSDATGGMECGERRLTVLPIEEPDA